MNKVENKICPYCDEKFNNIDIKVFANHVRWCKKNPKHDKICGKEFKEKISDKVNEHLNKKFGAIEQFEVECANIKCKKHFFVHERREEFPKKDHYFCSIKCGHQYAASFVTDQIKQQISKKLSQTKHIIKCYKCGKDIETSICVSRKMCDECKSSSVSNKKIIVTQDGIIKQKSRYDHVFELKQFEEIFKNKPSISTKEIAQIRKKVYKIYRILCSFRFSLTEFPEEFDFQSLKKCGMYSASNHGNNLNGVSRDHMFSVYDGFKQNVSPLLISHPANCQLILQRKNASKRTNSVITLDELKQRITKWELKYGKYNYKNEAVIPDYLFEKIKDAKYCHPHNYDGYSLIYEKTTLKFKWWDVKNIPIPYGWTIEMPLELKKQCCRKLNNFK